MKIKNNWYIKIAIIYITLLMVYGPILNQTFTSDHVGAWNKNRGQFPIDAIHLKSTLSVGRFMEMFTEVVASIFWRLGITIYKNQYVFKLFIVFASACLVLYWINTFAPFFRDRENKIFMAAGVLLGVANPFFVEVYTYVAYAWAIGLLISILAIHYFFAKRYGIAMICVFLLISSYQSYVALFLIPSIAIIYIEHGDTLARFVKTLIKMFIVAGIPSAANLILVKLFVVAYNTYNAKVIGDDFSRAEVIKKVSFTTGIIKRLYMMCAAYYGAAVTSFGMLPYGLFFVLVIGLVTASSIILIHEGKGTKLVSYLISIALINTSSVAIYFVIGGESLGILCRVIWPIFVSFSMTSVVSLYVCQNYRISRVMMLALGIFAMLNVYYTQRAELDFIIENKAETYEMRQIQNEIEKYEKETGIDIRKVACFYGENAMKHEYNKLLIGDYKIWTYHRRIVLYDCSNVELLNYINNENYMEVDSSICDNFFKGKSWENFDVKEQLLFRDDTLYWAVY